MSFSGSAYPAVAALSHPAVVLDGEHRVVFANEAARVAVGIEEDLRGLACHQAVHGEESVRPDCPLEEAKRTGRPTETDMFDQATGQWHRCGVYPMERGEGEAQLYLHTFEDITEHVESDREIQRLNRALRTISGSNQALLRTESEQELIEEVCRTAAETGGFRLAWVGKREQDERRSVTPLAVAGHDAGFLANEKVTWGDDPRGQGPTGKAIRTGRPVVIRSMEERSVLPWKDAAEKRGYASAASLPLIVDGEVFGALSLYAAEEAAFQEKEMDILQELASDIAFGISALRTRARRRRAEQGIEESEERYRMLVDNTDDFICSFDADLRYTAVNRALCEALHLRTDQIVGKNHDELGLPEEITREWEDLGRQVFESGNTLRTETSAPMADGKMHAYELILFPIKNRDGLVTGIRAVSRDITSRKKAEAELEESREQLHQSQKLESVGQLAGGIAHDFNNLLTVITGNTELLLNPEHSVDPESARDYLEEIRTAAAHGESLTGQLLAFSRRQPYRTRVVDLNDAVSKMDALLRRTMGEHIQVETKLDEDLWPVEIDPHRLEQILLNLAVNARDAMEEQGRLTIETANATLAETYVSTHLGSEPGDYVMLAVSDNGVGMNEETAARIFDPFFTTKREGKGTGLGLSTVYGIVKQFQGNIWVYSEPGEGTAFKIYLPRSRKEVDWSPAPEGTGYAKEAGGTETILVVEDEESVRKLTDRILTKEGYRVLTAASGAEALTHAEELAGALDLLVADVILPQMNGPDIAEKLRADNPRLRVLYMSGYTKDAITHEGRLADDVMLLEKPFGPTELTYSVREALDTDEDPG